MPKIVKSISFFALIMFGLQSSSCGRQSDEHTKLSAAARVPCGTDNEVPRLCSTDRSVDFEVRFDNIKRYTECGMSSADVYPAIDKTKPFLASTCAGSSGKFVSFGPFITIPETGWINAKVHVWPCPVSNLSMPEDLFALDVYSASLGGVLKRDIYNYSAYKFTKKNEFGGEIWDFAGTTSSLATSLDMKVGRWVEIPISAPITTSTPITDLEVRIQILSPRTCLQVLGKDITYTRHP